jgi:hypothetical protein
MVQHPRRQNLTLTTDTHFLDICTHTRTKAPAPASFSSHSMLTLIALTRLSSILILHKGINTYIWKTCVYNIKDVRRIMCYIIWCRWSIHPLETSMLSYCPVLCWDSSCDYTNKIWLPSKYGMGYSRRCTSSNFLITLDLRKMDRNGDSNIMTITFLTQSSNRTTMRIRESQFFIKLTSVLWSAFSMSWPLIDRITSP